MVGHEETCMKVMAERLVEAEASHSAALNGDRARSECCERSRQVLDANAECR